MKITREERQALAKDALKRAEGYTRIARSDERNNLDSAPAMRRKAKRWRAISKGLDPNG